MKKKNIGSSFDTWLREDGTYEEVTATAIKRVLARQVEAAMKEKQFSKAEMARRMHTSRAAVGRLLDREYDAVTSGTLRKAARPWAMRFGLSWLRARSVSPWSHLPSPKGER
ncbi:MAG: Fis family transcriptional regulator [Bryobacteraceae bacterium]